MIRLEQKKEIVDSLVPKLEKATGVYLVDFETMSVAETNEFRSQIREIEAEYIVVKNTLIQKALERIEGKEIPAEKLKGQSGIVLAYDDPTTPSKIIKETFESNDKPKLKAALLDGQLFDGSQLKQIAVLPSKEDMIAGIIGSLNSPASGIARAMGAVICDIASIIEEVAKKKREAA